MHRIERSGGLDIDLAPKLALKIPHTCRQHIEDVEWFLERKALGMSKPKTRADQTAKAIAAPEN
jgi:hypothetical protein